MADKPEVISTVKARGGVTPHVVRYVLLVSLLLAVAALVLVFASAPNTAPDAPVAAATR